MRRHPPIDEFYDCMPSIFATGVEDKIEVASDVVEKEMVVDPVIENSELVSQAADSCMKNNDDVASLFVKSMSGALRPLAPPRAARDAIHKRISWSDGFVHATEGERKVLTAYALRRLVAR